MTKKQSPAVDEAMASQIKFLIEDAGYLEHQAAARFGINQGRVSEIKTGKRFAWVPKASRDQIPPEWL